MTNRAKEGLARVQTPFVREKIFGDIAEDYFREIGEPMPAPSKPWSEVCADIADALQELVEEAEKAKGAQS
jgi:hypothetical protein